MLQSISLGNKISPTQVLLCHGFGASMRDLVDLVPDLDPDSQFGWHFLQAPIQMSPMSGYAWFPRDAQALYQAMMDNYFGALADLSEPGLGQSAAELAAWIQANFDHTKRWVVGGFSQGSMVALQLAIQEAINLAGVVILSGSLIDQTATKQLLSQAPQLPCFQSHGSYDQVLPLVGALSLCELLRQNNWPIEFCEFRGGHEIPYQVIEKLRVFLGKFNAGR